MSGQGLKAKVRVELGTRGYDILIGEGLLARAGELIRPLMGRFTRVRRRG